MSSINQYGSNLWDYLGCSNFAEEYTDSAVQVKMYTQEENKL